MAPTIAGRIAAALATAGVNYLDRNGNCHIVAHGLHISVKGNRPSASAGSSKGLRAAGYQVLFCYLAEKELLNATIRAMAPVAEVSKQAVSEMRRRLVHEGYIVKKKQGFRWKNERLQDALNLWVHGYNTVVRPSLHIATYRTRDANPGELESRLTPILENREQFSQYRWGGTTALYQLNSHYRGLQTTVHVRATPGDFRKRIQGVNDQNGNLVVLRAFGEINWNPESTIVHPLLVYTEANNERNDRAREAAQEFFETEIESKWAA